MDELRNFVTEIKNLISMKARHILLMSVMALLPALANAQTREVINFADQGWEAQASLLKTTVEGKGCTVSFANKGGKMGEPTYSGEWVSLYARNNVTITAKDKAIKSIVFTYGKGKPRTKVMDNGNSDVNYKFNKGDYDEPTRTWKGSSTVVTLAKQPGRGELDLVKMVITYSE